MRPTRLQNNTYRLEFGDGDQTAERAIEFEAPSTEAALFIAQRHCVDRPAHLFLRDRCLGSISLSGWGGYWKISGQAPAVPAPLPEAARDRTGQIRSS